MSVAAFPTGRLTRWVHFVYLGVLIGAYLAGWAGRDPVILTYAVNDDELFIRLAQSLAEWHWLGSYTETTLSKGPGYPIFLAIVSRLHLSPIPAESYIYLAGSIWLATSLRSKKQSHALTAILITAFLCLPVLAMGDETRLTRDFFYTSMTMLFFGSAIRISASRDHKATLPVLLSCGLFASWLLITREEGIWVLPAIILLVAGSVLVHRGNSIRAVVIPGAIVSMVTISGLIAVGLGNKIAYGEFLGNEVTQGSFPGALHAMEEAAYPEWRRRIPVPEKARLKLYEVSPAFAKLRPFIDPPDGKNIWALFGCQISKPLCGDIAGGWFLWNVREAAFRAGVTPTGAAASNFFRQLAKEIRGACRDGRLTCAWLPPLIPIFRLDDVPAIWLVRSTVFPRLHSRRAFWLD